LDSFSSDIEDVQEIVDEVEPRLELIEKKLQSNIENSFTKQLDKHTEILKKQI
jgi:iron uptake system EfeUOB component EfeO/EfeM